MTSYPTCDEHVCNPEPDLGLYVKVRCTPRQVACVLALITATYGRNDLIHPLKYYFYVKMNRVGDLVSLLDEAADYCSAMSRYARFLYLKSQLALDAQSYSRVAQKAWRDANRNRTVKR